MDKSKLKPCPFCGSKAECVENTGRQRGSKRVFHICCNGCSIMQTKWLHSKKEAIEAWNMRSEDGGCNNA